MKQFYNSLIICFFCFSINSTIAMHDDTIAVVANDGKCLHIPRGLTRHIGVIREMPEDCTTSDDSGRVFSVGKKRKHDQTIDFSAISPIGISLSYTNLAGLFYCIENQSWIDQIESHEKLVQFMGLADFLDADESVQQRLMMQLCNSNIDPNKLPKAIALYIQSWIHPHCCQDCLDLKGKDIRRAKIFLRVLNEEDREKIIEINLSNNKLEYLCLEEAIRLFPHLKKLDLSYNRLKLLSCPCLPHQFSLDCSSNLLRDLQITAIDGQQGLRIKCSENQMNYGIILRLKEQLEKKDLRYHLYEYSNKMLTFLQHFSRGDYDTLSKGCFTLVWMPSLPILGWLTEGAFHCTNRPEGPLVLLSSILIWTYLLYYDSKYLFPERSVRWLKGVFKARIEQMRNKFESHC